MRGYYAILDATPERLDLGAGTAGGLALEAHAGKLLAAAGVSPIRQKYVIE